MKAKRRFGVWTEAPRRTRTIFPDQYFHKHCWADFSGLCNNLSKVAPQLTPQLTFQLTHDVLCIYVHVQTPFESKPERVLNLTELTILYLYFEANIKAFHIFLE